MLRRIDTIGNDVRYLLSNAIDRLFDLISRISLDFAKNVLLEIDIVYLEPQKQANNLVMHRPAARIHRTDGLYYARDPRARPLNQCVRSRFNAPIEDVLARATAIPFLRRSPVSTQVMAIVARVIKITTFAKQ